MQTCKFRTPEKAPKSIELHETRMRTEESLEIPFCCFGKPPVEIPIEEI